MELLFSSIREISILKLVKLVFYDKKLDTSIPLTHFTVSII